MNTLNAAPGTWISTDSGTVKAEDNGYLTIVAHKKGSPVAAYFQPRDASDAKLSASSFVQVTIQQLQGSISVGIAKPSQIHAGYKTRGMFYNGNLTNGSAALRTSFGPRLQGGDRVGLLWETRSQESTKVWLYINDQCLGLAFDVANNDNESQRYLPCLHVNGTAYVTCDFSSPPPEERSRATTSTAHDPFVGEWKLVQAFYGPELGQFPLPDNHNIRATIQNETHGHFALSIKVANTFNLHMTLKGTKPDSTGWQSIINMEPVMSTRMMPAPEYQAVESKLMALGLPVITQIRVDDDSVSRRMLWQGPTAEFEWELYTVTIAPVTDLCVNK